MDRLSLGGAPQKGKSPRQKQNKKQQKHKKSNFFSEFGTLGGEVGLLSCFARAHYLLINYI